MPSLKLTVQITDEEAAFIKSWQVQGLAESDDEVLDSLIIIRSRKKNDSPTQPLTGARLRQNLFRRIVILIGVLVITGMMLVPPYKYYRQGGSGGDHAGYGFIFSPTPRIGLKSDGFGLNYQTDVYLDVPTLFIQCLLVSVLTAISIFLLSRYIKE